MAKSEKFSKLPRLYTRCAESVARMHARAAGARETVQPTTASTRFRQQRRRLPALPARHCPPRRYTVCRPARLDPSQRSSPRLADVMELVDIPDLKSGGRCPCGFESRRPHQTCAPCSARSFRQRRPRRVAGPRISPRSMYYQRKREADHAGRRASVNAVAAMASLVERANDQLLAVCKWLIITIVGVLAVILIAAVFYRYALNNAIAWSEEGSKYLMVWLTFLGAPIALRHAAHINIDLAGQALPAPRPAGVLFRDQPRSSSPPWASLLWKGWEFAELGARQVASSFNFSMVWMYVAVPIGSALTCLVAIELALKALTRHRRSERASMRTSPARRARAPSSYCGWSSTRSGSNGPRHLLLPPRPDGARRADRVRPDLRAHHRRLAERPDRVPEHDAPARVRRHQPVPAARHSDVHSRRRDHEPRRHHRASGEIRQYLVGHLAAASPMSTSSPPCCSPGFRARRSPTPRRWARS